MHPKVRDLYKRVILAGRDYPGGMEVVKRRSKEWFRSNSALTDERDILKAVAKGRAYLRDEVIAAIQLRKYRVMRERYKVPEEEEAARQRQHKEPKG